jgi:hypothetical protein
MGFGSNIFQAARIAIDGVTIIENIETGEIGVNSYLPAEDITTTNVALGINTLESVTTGISNEAIGAYALQDTTSGSYNVAVGLAALTNNTTGSGNVVLGWSALAENSTGDANTAVGQGALIYYLGNNTTALGNDAGRTDVTGDGNTYLGTLADCNVDGYHYSTAIGSSATITASHQMMLGDSGLLTVVTAAKIIPGGFQLVTGAGAGLILISDASGNASWAVPVSATAVSSPNGTLTVSLSGATLYADINPAHSNTWTAHQTINTAPGTALIISGGGLEVSGSTTNSSSIFVGSSSSVSQSLNIVANDIGSATTKEYISIRTNNSAGWSQLIMQNFSATQTAFQYMNERGAGDYHAFSNNSSIVLQIGDGSSNPAKITTTNNTLDDGTTGQPTFKTGVASATFTTANGKTVTVTGGIITSIV